MEKPMQPEMAPEMEEMDMGMDMDIMEQLDQLAEEYPKAKAEIDALRGKLESEMPGEEEMDMDFDEEEMMDEGMDDEEMDYDDEELDQLLG